jgi:hypothetical protein
MDKYVIVLDTETTNSLEEPLCYDIGLAVIDTELGIVVEHRSFVIAEIFLDRLLMNSAYFKEKIPQYWNEIKNGSRVLCSFRTARFELCRICKYYGIKIICAHNARFDYLSCNLTQRYLTKSKYRYFFPYGTKIFDTLKMSREVFKDDNRYDNFCKENNYLTSRGQNRFTAEIIYRFLNNDNSFEESHTGLEDVLIEKDIFLYCINNGVTNGNLFQ